MSSSSKDTVPGSGLYPGQDSNHGGMGLGACGSLALQALYSTNAAKNAFASLSCHNQPALMLDSDDNKDDKEWEDRMDPVTFARYYADQNPHFAKIVQDHDVKMCECLNEGIVSWMESVQSETVT